MSNDNRSLPDEGDKAQVELSHTSDCDVQKYDNAVCTCHLEGRLMENFYRMKQLHEEAAALALEAISQRDYPFGWCRNCNKATEHERRNTDLCCTECSFIAFTYHEKKK